MKFTKKGIILTVLSMLLTGAAGILTNIKASDDMETAVKKEVTKQLTSEESPEE